MTNLLTVKQQPIRCKDDGMPSVLKDYISPRLKEKNSYLQRGTVVADKKKADERKNSTNDSLSAIISSPPLAAVDSNIISQSPGRRLSMTFHTPRQKRRQSVKASASIDDAVISGILGSYASPGAMKNISVSKSNSAKGEKKGFLGGSNWHGNTTSPGDIAKYSAKGAKGRFRGLGFEDLKDKLGYITPGKIPGSINKYRTPPSRSRSFDMGFEDLEDKMGCITPGKSPGSNSKHRSRSFDLGFADLKDKLGCITPGISPGSNSKHRSRSFDLGFANLKDKLGCITPGKSPGSNHKHRTLPSSRSFDPKLFIPIESFSQRSAPCIDRDIPISPLGSLQSSPVESSSRRRDRSVDAVISDDGSEGQCMGNISQQASRRGERSVDTVVLDESGIPHQRRRRRRASLSDLEAMTGGSWSRLDTAVGLEDITSLLDVRVTPRKSPGNSKRKSRGSRDRDTNEGNLIESKSPGSIRRRSSRSDDSKKSSAASKSPNNVKERESKGRRRSGSSKRGHSFACISDECSLAESLSFKTERKTTAKPTVERQGSSQRCHSVHCLANDSFLDSQVELGESVSKQIEAIARAEAHQIRGSHRTVESSIAKWSQLLDKRHKSDLESHDGGVSLDGLKRQDSFQNLFMVSDKDKTNGSRTIEAAKAGLEGFDDNDIESDSGEITRKAKGIPSEENGGRNQESVATAGCRPPTHRGRNSLPPKKSGSPHKLRSSLAVGRSKSNDGLADMRATIRRKTSLLAR
jgi:hypothetical protein